MTSSRDADRASRFHAIFEADFVYVWSTLRHLGARAEDVEDLTHDVFLRVYGKLDEYDAARPIRAWLFGFAYRVASDHRRLARHRLEAKAEHPEASDPGASPEQRAAAGEDRALLLDALDEIDLERRAVIVMHDVDECSAPDIATTLGIPVNTVYSRLRVARDELATAVRRARARRGER